MTSLLILLACTSLTAKTTPVAAKDRVPEAMSTNPSTVKPVTLPTTPLVQQECFASSRPEVTRGRGSYLTPPPSPAKSSSGASYDGSPAPVSAPMAKAPSGSTSPASPGGSGAMGPSTNSVASTASAPVASTAPPAEPAAAMPMAGADKKAYDGLTARAKEKSNGDAGPADRDSGAKDEGRAASKPMAEKGDEEMSTKPTRQLAPSVPEPDWGATVYLSNDDSMSLASAQRLLWALQNHGPVKTSEIRPHELLNYFSFDTADVKDGQIFSTLGAAQQTDPDTLTMSFAVKGYTPAPKPLDLTLVLDRSGSMAAEGRMEYLKRGLLKLTEGLHAGDRLDLVLFDHEVCAPLENFVVGRDDPSLLAATIARLAPRGSTNLGIGLGKGYALATGRDLGGVGEQGRNKRMMLVTDALMNEGQIDPNILSEIGRGYEQAGVNLTAVGVGTDFNDKVLDQLSEKGHGAYVYLGSEAVVDRVFGVGLAALTRTIARDVHFSVDLPPSLAMERFYGEESSTHKEDVQPINYFAGNSQLFLQDLKIRRGQIVPNDPVVFTAEWVDPETGAPGNQTFHTTVGTLLASDSHNLVKGRALMAWSDLLMNKSLGGQVCGAPMDTWRQHVSELGQDAEISWLDGLTSPLCGQTPVPVQPAARTVALKIKLDSDMPIAEVGLTCGSWRATDALAAGDQVARFDARPGACQLTLQGNVPMTTMVQVPETGADLRCVVRGGRFSCS
ncbi:MAG: VWA domain-containing protein [Myxococcales bacterium]|nr:VWA domain-containing protein [Myxococcales bacterium]